MPEIKGISTETAELLNSQMVRWSECAALKTATLQQIERELDRLIEQAARLRGYVEMRHGSGCGDQGHADAVKESNRLAAGVRKVLGFTLPRQEVRF